MTKKMKRKRLEININFPQNYNNNSYPRNFHDNLNTLPINYYPKNICFSRKQNEENSTTDY